MKRLIAVGLLAAALAIAWRPLPARTASAPLTAPPPYAPPRLDIARALHVACDATSPVHVEVRALSTPVLGRDLFLQVSARNSRATSDFETAILTQPGALVAIDDSLVTTRSLPASQVVSWTVHARVMARGPIGVVARARPLLADPHALPGLGRTVLFPFQVKDDGSLSAAWSAPTSWPVSLQRQLVVPQKGRREITQILGAKLISVSGGKLTTS